MSGAGARRSQTLPALIALGILNHTVLTGSRVTVSPYALSLNASPLVVGTLIGLYSFLPMWCAVAAGRLSDRIGVRRPMLMGSCGLAIAALLPPIFPGLAALLVTTSLIGLAFMLFQVAAQNATGAPGPPDDRARNFTLLAPSAHRSGSGRCSGSSAAPLSAADSSHAGAGAAQALSRSTKSFLNWATLGATTNWQ